jgi:hypothetical protein
MALTTSNLSELHSAVTHGGSPTCLLSKIAESPLDLGECEVLDFKRQLPTTAVDYADAIRDIVALHNSHGGFLVFGVTETARDSAFEIIGVGESDLSKSQLRDLIRAYTGADVRVETFRAQVRQEYVVIVWVAKRSIGDTPVRFVKNGPDEKPGKPIFKKNDVAFRRLDTNALASVASDYDFLFSERNPPSLVPNFADGALGSTLEHNLPDRGEICATFVGRADDQADLWRWMADDFSRVRLIAGEGGLGKTSLAYTFAEHVTSRRIKPFNKVVWLSAKQQQFVAAHDRFMSKARVDYKDAQSLFEAIATSLGNIPKDVEGLDAQDSARLALAACDVLPSFIVIDDIDSLTKDDQQRALEFGMRVPVGSKVLLTTRVNFSYSPDNVLKLDGLQKDEFREFVHVLRKRYGLQTLTEGRIEAIRRDIGGSPLFADSLFRLERRGLHIDQALAQWKGKAGLDVRKAALSREVQQLSHTARRALYVVSTLRNCSYVELSQVLDYSDQTLGDALQELSGLFLIDAPAIAKEARFTVEPTTRLLVLETASGLAIDHSALDRRIKASNNDAVGIGLQKRSSIVAQAISQANAMLREGDPKGALDVVVAASKSLSQPHPDLLLAIGRFSLSLAPPNRDAATKAFEEAFALGQRKALLFDLWFDTESRRGALESARDIAAAVIDGGLSDQPRWLERRGQIHLALAMRADSKVSNDAKLRELNFAIRDFKDAKRCAGDSAVGGRVDQILAKAQSYRADILRGDTRRLR